jgi:VanZ family protein
MAASAGARWRAWIAVAAWAGLISLFSSGLFSGAHTGAVLLPLLHGLFPGASPELLAILHASIRKAAHVVEYLVLGLLLVRALRQEGLRGRALAAAAMALGVGYAALDELHQTFVPSRTPSPRDVAVDALGVTAGVALAARRRPVRHTEN